MTTILPKLRIYILIGLSGLAGACATGQSQQSLYEQLDGLAGITLIADFFIEEIAYDDRVFARFADSNVERFREKIIEHFCMIADGPCLYTGDSMLATHQGMFISDAEFNAVVEDLITAMERATVPLPAQNRLLARLAALKSEIAGV